MSYAMFFNKSTSEDSTKLGNLDVEYVDGEEVTIDDLLPINNDEVEEKANVFNFSVENKGNSYAYYDIKFVDIDLPTALKDLTLKWRLIKDGQIVNEGNFLEIENTKYYLKRSIGIDGKDINKYKLQIWIENSNKIDQSYMLNRSGSFKIQIEAKQKLASSPKNEITVISNTTNGDLEDLKIYGNTIDGKNVGDNKTINITVSQNLVDNGLGELGNNTNFSNLTYSDEKYKSLGSFYSVDNNKKRNFFSNNNIAVDIDKSYHTSISLKNNNSNASYLFGFSSFDIDNLKIDGVRIAAMNNFYTFLIQDLKDGDEYVYFNDLSKFNINAIQECQTGLIFWNYTDSRGYTYPVGAYSRNNWCNLFVTNNIDKENNRIKLNEPWKYGTYKKGTYVSQTTGIGSETYCFTKAKKLTNEWVEHNATISGTYNFIADEKSVTINKFRYGTKYVKIYFAINREQIAETTTYYSRIILRKNDNIQNITIDMNGHEPLRSIDDTRDYIDYKNKRIVRVINSDGTIKSNPEYEPITLPEIKTYDGNTIIESNDEISPLFQAEY